MDIYTKPEQIIGTAYIWAVPIQSWEMTDELRAAGKTFKYQISTLSNIYTEGAVRVHEFEVSATVPEGINLVERAIATLEDTIDTRREEFLRYEAAIKEQISKLLMLEAR